VVSAGRGVSYLWLQNVVSSAARVVAFAFFARLISVDEMGVFTILSLAYSGAGVLMGLGLSSVVTKFVAENIAQGKKMEAASVSYKSLLLGELASIIAAAGVILSKFPAGVSHLPNSPLISTICILFAIDLIATLGPTTAAVFYGLLEFRDYALIYAVYASVRPFMVVLFVYETGSIVGLVEGWVISDTALTAYVLLYLWRRLGPPVFRFSTKYLLKLSSPLYLASIATFLYGSFDQLTLIPLVSLTALGVYGAAVTAFGAYINLIGVFGAVMLPVFAGVHGVKGREVLGDSIRTASRYVSILAMPFAFALIATARPALTLLVGGAYQGGVIPLAVLALGSIASIVAMSLSPVLIVLNETTLAALASILPIPLSVALALISIPVLGILGASMARALSMLLSLVLTWYFVRRKITVKLDSPTILKSVVAGGFMASVMEALQLFYYSRFLLPAYLAVGLLAYLLGMRALKAMSTTDIDLLRRILGPRSGRMCDLLSLLVIPKIEEGRKSVKKRTSEIIGKKVVDAYGSVLGSAVDVEFDVDNTPFSLIVSRPDNKSGRDSKELLIEANEIARVKDVVLLKTGHEEKQCPKCGYANRVAASYCRQCGTALS
jgi:O-antigen/teichoic acid export membrane protein/sporulation protein YlmC with PRC-barrel domain